MEGFARQEGTPATICRSPHLVDDWSVTFDIIPASSPLMDERSEPDTKEGVMKSKSQSVASPDAVSLLLRVCRRFRISKTQGLDEAKTMRDLLALDGLDINGRPLELSGIGHSSLVTPGAQPIRLCVAEPQAAAGSDVLFNMEFSYRGSGGQTTQRLVSVWVCDPEYFAGHCHLRDGYRLFSWDNVDGHVRLHDTGELLETEEIRRRFA